ncbi:MAG: hypothetical protein ABIJ59_19515 [Pseudomonadota bacterium]
MTIKETILNLKPTVYKTIICEKHRIPVKAVSKHLELSYTHTVNLLNGLSRITPEMKARLDKIVQELEG